MAVKLAVGQAVALLFELAEEVVGEEEEESPVSSWGHSTHTMELVLLSIPWSPEWSVSDVTIFQLLDKSVGGASYELIQQLATESDRYTGRRERNAQRSCFRDVLSTLEDGTVPDREVRFGVELLQLDSWAR